MLHSHESCVTAFFHGLDSANGPSINAVRPRVDYKPCATKTFLIDSFSAFAVLAIEAGTYVEWHERFPPMTIVEGWRLGMHSVGVKCQRQPSFITALI